MKKYPTKTAEGSRNRSEYGLMLISAWDRAAHWSHSAQVRPAF